MANVPERSTALPVSDPFTFGQLLVRPLGGGKFRLSHRDDADSAEGLQVFDSPEAGLEIARGDDEGNYRPLKTAPTLRRGWQLEVTGLAALREALDYVYPGRREVLAAHNDHRLSTTSLRDTLNRQSGMYRVAANISDSEIDDVVGNFCRSNGGCLRTILWKRDGSGTVPSTKLPPQKFDPAHDQALEAGAPAAGAVSVPLLCQEACNLLVAECRRVVKG